MERGRQLLRSAGNSAQLTSSEISWCPQGSANLHSCNSSHSRLGARKAPNNRNVVQCIVLRYECRSKILSGSRWKTHYTTAIPPLAHLRHFLDFALRFWCADISKLLHIFYSSSHISRTSTHTIILADLPFDRHFVLTTPPPITSSPSAIVSTAIACLVSVVSTSPILEPATVAV